MGSFEYGGVRSRTNAKKINLMIIFRIYAFGGSQSWAALIG